MLAKRRGRLLTRRTILKSYLFHEDQPPASLTRPVVRVTQSSLISLGPHSLCFVGGVLLTEGFALGGRGWMGVGALGMGRGLCVGLC